MKILFVAGAGRSGSTLLSSLLGELPGFLAVGEPYYLWEEGLEQNRLCGCGERFRDCPYWRDVLASAGLSGPDFDFAGFRRLHATTARSRHLPLLTSGWTRDALLRRRSAYLQGLRELYESMLRHGPGEILVDASKLPSYGQVLRAIAGDEFYVVHLVRDPRAVAYSWGRDRRNPASGKPVRRLGAVKSSLIWTTWNLAAERLGRDAGGPHRSVRIRYEDLVARPGETLGAIVDLLGRNGVGRGIRTPSSTDFSTGIGHSIGGNPVRFSPGRTRLRLDDEWKRAQTPWARLAVLFLCWPLLGRYRYAGGA